MSNEMVSADLRAAVTHVPAEHRPVDEYANLVTHGLGFVLSVLGSVVLMTLVADHSRAVIIACGVYCLTLVALYGASMLSHTFHDLAWRRCFRTVDQACIYLLAAGSCTPFGVVFFQQTLWAVFIVVMWIMAICGVILVLRMRNLTPVAMLTYLVHGWLPIVIFKSLVDTGPYQMAAWVFAGGVCYSVGTLFLAFDRHVRYFHALWHTLVIAGSTCHYIAVLYLLKFV